MASIGSLDLEFLHLGYHNGGTFNEKDIEDSELNRLGVGRVLDAIASLKERNLITQNQDNTFSITNGARQILWNDEIPLWVKILRLLEIKSLSLGMITKYLEKNNDEIYSQIENLRKNELVLMSSQRTQNGIEKIFEILPLGVEELEKINSEGYDSTELILERKTSDKDVFEILDEIKEMLENTSLETNSKKTILEKIEQIKLRLKI